MEDRKIFAAIIYLLRTGIQWNALPREQGASSTVHDRFQEWQQKGFFKTLWQMGLTEYDEVQGIEWEWQSVDGAMTKAPFGCAATGANPTDRGKRGVKRSLLTDGAGIPLALVVDGAHRHGVKLLAATLDGVVIARPEPTEEYPQHLDTDAAYDGAPARQEVQDRQYIPHIQSREKKSRRKSSRLDIEHAAGWWRPPNHNTPETLRLTDSTPRPMLGISGLLNLLTWVEHRQLAQASPHEEGGVPCPVPHPTRLPPTRFQASNQLLGGSASGQSSAASLAAESPARTSAGAQPRTRQGGRR